MRLTLPARLGALPFGAVLTTGVAIVVTVGLACVLAWQGARAEGASGAEGASALAAWEAGRFAEAYEAARGSPDVGDMLLAARSAVDVVVYGDPAAPTAGDSASARTWLDRGAELAEAAVAAQPDLAAAYVMLARARGELALVSGVLQNLSVAPELKKLFDQALALDPDDPDALVGLAMWHLELVERNVAWLYGGKRSEVLPLLERGVAAAPEQVNLRIEYATALLALGMPADARAQLQAALDLPALNAADRFEQENARRMLADEF